MDQVVCSLTVAVGCGGGFPLPSPSLCGGREPQHTPRLRRRTPKTEVTAWWEARGSRQSTLQQETACPGASVTGGEQGLHGAVCPHGRCPPRTQAAWPCCWPRDPGRCCCSACPAPGAAKTVSWRCCPSAGPPGLSHITFASDASLEAPLAAPLHSTGLRGPAGSCLRHRPSVCPSVRPSVGVRPAGCSHRGCGRAPCVHGPAPASM